jgi:hypothetical protein
LTGPNITSIHGGAIAHNEPNEGCIETLRDLLQRAESGDITGIVCATLHSDKTASYSLAGLVGPYSMLGAIDMAKTELADIMKATR